MQSLENFTIDELVIILNGLDIDSILGPESKDESDLNLRCCIGPLSFGMYMNGDAPFFDGFNLIASRFVRESPFLFLNKYNGGNRVSRASVGIDDDGLIKLDDDDEMCIYAIKNVFFAGGVTKEHLIFQLCMWLEDLIDFNEIVLDEEEYEEHDATIIPELNDLPGTTLLSQILACLSCGRSMTSREIGKLLEIDRHAINPILYKETKRFSYNQDQPPLWSLKK